MHPFSLAKALTAFAIMSLSGCATLSTQPLKPLHVVPVDLHLSGGGLLAQSVNLTLKVDNPNPFPVSIEEIQTELWINERPIACGVTRTKLQLHGQQEVKVKATVQTLSLLSNIARLGVERPLTYRLKGKLRVKRAFLPAVEIPFEVQDRLDFWNFFNRQAIPIPYQE